MRRLLIEIALFFVLLVVVVILWERNGQLREERDRYQRNTTTLICDIEQYRVADSLNAAKRNALELRLAEYENLRANDASLIRQLRADKRDLERITAAQIETITQLSTTARDTLIIRDSVDVPALSLEIHEQWYDFDGLLENGKFTGTIINRDSLMVVESVKMSRCIVKKWRRVKTRSVDVISKNPNTIIQGIEYVIIEK